MDATSTAISAVKQGSTVRTVVVTLTSVFIIFLLLDLVSAFVYPGASSFVLQPFSAAKALWAKYKSKGATPA